MTASLPPLPSEIGQAIEQRKFVLFLGAGISCAAGLYSWKSVKENIVNAIPVEDSVKNQYRRMNNYYSCFQQILNKHPGVFKRILDESLQSSPDKITTFKKLLNSLRSLGPTLIVTTNVDNLLQETEIYQKEQFRFMENCSIEELGKDIMFCIHGNRQKNIFTLNALNNIYADPHFTKFINNVFGSYHVLFVGYSFGDSKLLEHLLLHPNHQNKGLKRHFALLPSNHVDPPIIELFDMYGISSITYPVQNNNYQEFGETIMSWDKNSLSLGNNIAADSTTEALP